MPTTSEMYILYLLLGAVAAMIYSLRRIYLLENKIELMEENILSALKKRK
ncbi:hypothetical protein J4471_02165 [Candidatus Woesearchaeota archaeon]|nr:hypothetical protein [Candidatus Woesearchaeota archaeon]